MIEENLSKPKAKTKQVLTLLTEHNQVDPLKPKAKRKQVLNCQNLREEVSQELSVKCDLCNEIIECSSNFLNPSDIEIRKIKSQVLKEHSKTVHGIGNLQVCEICGYQTKLVKNIEEHWITSHSEQVQKKFKLEPLTDQSDFLCDYCSLTFDCETVLKNHTLICKDRDSYEKSDVKKCSNCDYETTNPGSFACHTRSIIECDHCDKVFCGKIAKKKYRQHSKEHIVKPKFLLACDHCKKTFKFKSHLNKHQLWSKCYLK